MKQFQFRLDTVLHYKEQILDTRLVEHGRAVSQAKAQEQVLAKAVNKLRTCEAEYECRKSEGMTAMNALQYQSGLQALERSVKREEETLKSLRKIEEEKRSLVAAARRETSSLEKLRERKEDEYNTAEKKADERMIDELMVRKIAGSF